MAARIVILTGERGVGKSTVCWKTVELARANHYICGGVLTLGRSDGGRDVLDVRSGHVRRLTLEAGGHGGVVQGRYRFDPGTLAWGSDILTCAPPCHLLVVDELGPLEIERGEGWWQAFDVLREGGFALALVVVRPELSVQAQRKLPAGATTVLIVTPHNRDKLPGVLLGMLGREASATSEA